MTEFKQIIGRGTRVNEEYGKYSFTIMDFRNVTNLFADPAFDGDPEQIYEPGEGDPPIPPDMDDDDEEVEGGEEFPPDYPGGDEEEDSDYGDTEDGPSGGRRRVYYVNNVRVKIINERVQYINEEGKLITESLKDYTKKKVNQTFVSLDDFLRKWNDAERKDAIIEELLEQGVLLNELQQEVGKDFDPFDLICHVAFEMKPLTRRERAINVKKRNYFTKYGAKARAVLEALLDKYADEGIENIESMEVLKLQPFDQFGSLVEIVRFFGGKSQYVAAVKELEQQIYTSA